MNLTYEVNDNGYIILNNGVPWIVQDVYIPHPASTMAESAQLHIDELIINFNKPIIPTDTTDIKIDELRTLVIALGEAITDIQNI